MNSIEQNEVYSAAEKIDELLCNNPGFMALVKQSHLTVKEVEWMIDLLETYADSMNDMDN